MSKRIVLLQALASTPPDIDRIVRALDDDSARWRPRPDAWSCADVVSHLAYVEALYRARLRRVIDEDEPAVPYIHPDERAHDLSIPLPELVAAFRASRDETLAFLQTVTPGGWNRPAIHETKGRTTLRFLVQDLVGHDIDHTNQLVEVVQLRRAHLKALAAS